MWSRTYSRKVKDIKSQDVWKVWTDVSQWHIWQDDIESATLVNKFEVGNKIILKLKNGPKVSMELIKVEKNRAFTDLTRFPFAKMYGAHEFIVHNNNTIEIKETMSICGLLAFVWRKLVAEKVAADSEHQTNRLIERVLQLTKNN